MQSDGSKPRKVEEAVRRTCFVESLRLSAHLGAEVTIASETFQWTGSFKFRAAYHVAASVPQRKIIASSSGNFGQAMAWSCSQLGKACIIVMPSDSARVKVEAVRGFGGTVDLVDVRRKSRQARVEELSQEHPDAYVASAYDDSLVIEGNATLGRELAANGTRFDFIVAPVGGGGLTAGSLKGLRESGCQFTLVGAEP